MSNKLIGDTDFLGLPLFKKGKVRDIYDFGDKLLVIATDRISAFDVVFPTLIPQKGKVLNGISEFWFNYTKDIVGNHMITTNIDEYPKMLLEYREEIEGRSMLVKKASVIPVECIVRGYLEGSGLKEYIKTGTICGIRLPKGLRQCDRLPEPIFTPTTKAEQGHDESITFDDLVDMIGVSTATTIRDLSILLYIEASKYAKSKGIIVADTKLEFGLINGEINVVDEMFTPDSSRFWDANDYEPGRPQKSFDKQYLREYLESIGWDKKPPAPDLPDYVVKNTSAKYIEAYERITGKTMEI